MTDSITKRIVDAVEADMADSTVLFLTGKQREKQNAAKRRIIFIRERGQLSPSTAPKGVNQATKAKVIFQRAETFRIVLHAETEHVLDQLFDNLVHSVWNKFAPNVFEDTSDYTWNNEDAENAGSHMARNPSITLLLTFRLMSRGPEKLTTLLEDESFTFDLE